MKLKNPEIRFEITNRCNFTCKVCPRQQMTRSMGTMSMDLFKKLIHNGVKIGLKYVTLTSFGEPFLDKSFFDRVRIAKKYDLYVSADTNGYLVDEKVSHELVTLCFDNIRFSIFAATPDIYEKVHGINGYNRVISNIQNLLKIRNESNFLLPKVGVYYLELEENQAYTQEFINYWKDRVDEVSIWKAHNWIDTFDFRKKGSTKRKTCGRPINGPLQIRWDGQVSACCFDYNNKLIIGDVSNGNYEDLFNDKRYKKIVKAHKEGDLRDFQMCDNCDQLYDATDSLIFSTEKKNMVGTSGNTFFRVSSG